MTVGVAGYPFSVPIKVRYAEIDGQKVVFNSRYLEYVDVAVSEYWEWTGIGAALGAAWFDTEFHVRRVELDYLKPFVLGDTIEAAVRIERLGNSSLAQRFALAHAATGDIHCEATLVNVNVHLPTGRPLTIEGDVRAFLEGLLARQPDRHSAA